MDLRSVVRAAATAAVVPPLDAVAESGRWYVRLDGGPDHDLWLIGWPPGTGVPWHDHGGVAGCFTLIEGRLLESAATEHGVDARWHDARDRVVVDVDNQRIHAMMNVDDRLAVSLHAYTPRLESMTFFSAEDGSLRPSRSSRVDGLVELVR